MDDDVRIANEELMKCREKSRKRIGNGTSPRIAGKDSPFICKKEILDLVPVSSNTLYNMIKDGRFPKKKDIGGNVAVWSRKEVNDWLSSVLA